MEKRWLMLLLVLAATSARATDSFDANRVMAEMVWQKRVLLLFAPDLHDADLRQQDEILQAADGGLAERDLVVIRAFADDRVRLDGRRHSQSAASFYQKFAVDPAQFRVILVGKDGSVKLERDRVVADGDLFQLIDSMPMRRYEMSRDG